MILLTGVSGFIGKHLLSALIKDYGAEQILALTSKPITECPYLLHHNYTFEDSYFVKSGYDSIRTIIHAGAFTPKNGSEANDWAKCNSNIFNTGKLLLAHLPNLKKIIYLSTLDVYGNDDIVTERTLLEPVSLYGASKLYGEKMISCWSKENKKICQLLRLGHVYGPGEESYQKIIPITIQKLLKNRPLEIWGTGNEIRSFIYINDIVKAILQSLKLEISIGAINLVGGQQITIRALIEKLAELSGGDAQIEIVPTDAKGRDLVFDNSRMKEFLLSSEISLDEGLTEEWEYMKQQGE